MVKLTNKLLMIGVLLFSAATSANTASDQSITEIIPALEKNIARTMKANDIPGVAVAIVSRDKIYYIKGFGVKKVGQQDKITPTTLFQIGSLSKPVHATLLGVLQDQGKLSFQDPVSHYVPNFKVANTKQPIKICHLMSHSTGVPNNGFNERIEAYAPRENIIQKLQKTKAIAQPGKSFVYHNAMYGVVEDVVNSACGKRLDTVIKQELFTPLGMQHASLGYEQMEKAPDKAYPHVPNGRGKYMPAPKYSTSYYAFPAAGGINASVQDLVPFLQLYLGKPSHIVSKITLEQLTHPFVKNPKAVIVWQAKKGRVTNPSYGLGWHQMNYANKKIVYHQGHLKGFRNFMGYVEDDVGIIILTNAEKKHASTIALNFFDLYLSARAKH